MSAWHPACRVDDLPVDGMRPVDVGGTPVMLVRLRDGFFALDDRCTHGDASLSDGEIDGDEVECPFHGGRFNVRTGEACAHPCTVNARTHACRIEGDTVLVAVGAGDAAAADASEAPTLDVQVLERRDVAADIVALRLARADGGPLPAYDPGAHVDLHLGDGLVRQYSLCCPQPAGAAYRIAVQREPASRGGSAHVHASLREGARLRMGLPRNDFAIVPEARMHLLLAGGIGITPLLSMAHAFAARGQAFALHHWVRSRARAAFGDELRAFGDRFALHVDDEPATHADFAPLLAQPAADTHLYVCGPRGFMDAALAAARAAGWPPSHLHREYFSPAAAAA